MNIPALEGTPVGEAAEGGCAWSQLTATEQREQLLASAADVFSERGLEAPMSLVAERAGVGVASIYRRFPSKQDLYAALVIRRMDQLCEAARLAERSPGDRWTALTGMLRTQVATQSVQPFVGEARAIVAGRPDVEEATTRWAYTQERLLAAARQEGRLRGDATPLDLQLLFAATRAAKRVEPDLWPRMLELMLDALDSRR